MQAVEEAEREWQHAAGALQLKIDRRGLAVGREQREGRIDAGGKVEEALGQLEWLVALVAVQPEDEVGLNVRDIAHDEIYVIGHSAHLVEPHRRPGPRL